MRFCTSRIRNTGGKSCYLEHGALAALAGLCDNAQVPRPNHVRLDLLGGATSGVGQRFHQHTVTNTQLHPFPGRGQPESYNLKRMYKYVTGDQY
jgi:hypothetical protein